MIPVIAKLKLELKSDRGTISFSESRSLQQSKIQAIAISLSLDFRMTSDQLVLSYVDCLFLFKETDHLQDAKFYYETADEETELVFRRFAESYTSLNANTGFKSKIDEVELKKILSDANFIKRTLTDFQVRDVIKLLSLPNGANFSVPGAGKTTVALALNICLAKSIEKTLVICPKSAFEAWDSIVGDCIEDASEDDKFQFLSGSKEYIWNSLNGKGSRFYINSESANNFHDTLRKFMLKYRTHLIIDESHRIKGGYETQRGAFAMKLAPLAFRRDIMSGTPMPQSVSDIASQIDFLYPAHGFGARIYQGEDVAAVMKDKFVRTRKDELKLPKRTIDTIDVKMSDTHLIFYSSIVDDLIKQYAEVKLNSNAQIQLLGGGAIRMLQASVYPQLVSKINFGQRLLLNQLVDEGPSLKMLRIVEICRENAMLGKKTIVWTIFSETIMALQSMMMDLDAQIYYGGARDIQSGNSYDRVQSLNKFKNSSMSFVLIANPAAGSEGLSLHLVCHEALYLDRTYNASHFLQSIDRIHRLGLPEGTTTQIRILRTVTPVSVPNIDMSVWRRVKIKIENLENLLEDPDLREIALSEDDVESPIDQSMDRGDIMDLIDEFSKKTESNKA